MSQTNTDPETASQPMTGTWSDLIGHDRIRDWFATAIKQGRFGGSMLFVGPPGSGKKTAAKLLAKTLLCEQTAPASMSPAGPAVPAQVEADTHVDVIRVSKPDDKATIPLEYLIGEREARTKDSATTFNSNHSWAVERLPFLKMATS